MSILSNIVIGPIELIFDAIFCYLQSYPGIAIVAISLVMNFLALPLYQRADMIQEEENAKAKSMSKWVTHIKKTFKGDERYLMLTEYYRQQNYKPIYSLRGLIPLLLQLPFFIAAYHYLSTQTLLNGVSFLFLKDLAQPDGLLKVGGISVNVMPLVMTAINFVSSYIYLRGAPVKSKIQTYGIAVIFLVLLYTCPSGLVFYWTLNQIFSAVKNTFMKIIRKKKNQAIVIASFGSLCIFVTAVLGILCTPSRLIFAALAEVVCLAPLASLLIKERFADRLQEPKPIRPLIFFMGTVFCTVLVGAMIPLAVVDSDPSEFLNVVNTPTSLVLGNVSLFAGLFIFWFGIFYVLSAPRGRNIFTYLAWIMSGAFLADYLFFPGDYGFMESDFVFSMAPTFPGGEMKLNLAVLAILCVVLFFILFKWKKVATYALTILILSCTVFSVIYGVRIADAMAAPEADPDTGESICLNPVVDSIVLSKTEQNVLLFVPDKAFSAYLPYIFEEKPELLDSFDGFTYYPNSLSCGIMTKWASPALYGGYEYAPLVLNERSDEPLFEKHDEAISVLPAIFSRNGYDVTVQDPPLAGYEDQKIGATVYNFDTAIKRLEMDEHIETDMLEQYGGSIQEYTKKNLALYCIFRVVPTKLRGILYREEGYLHTTQIRYTEMFLRQYATFEALPEVTEAVEDDQNHFLMLYTTLPHRPTILDAPDYAPTEDVTTDIQYTEEDRVIDGKHMHLDTFYRVSHYDANVATYMLLADFLDRLRELDVYDNTRIIIASDHGANMWGQFDTYALENGKDMEGFNCLLMVKDFNSTGDMQISEDYMMNADVAWLATNATVEDATNPFTGNEIRERTLDEKHDVVLTFADNALIDFEEKLFDTSLGWTYKFHGQDVYDMDSWEWIK